MALHKYNINTRVNTARYLIIILLYFPTRYLIIIVLYFPTPVYSTVTVRWQPCLNNGNMFVAWHHTVGCSVETHSDVNALYVYICGWFLCSLGWLRHQYLRSPVYERCAQVRHQSCKRRHFTLNIYLQLTESLYRVTISINIYMYNKPYMHKQILT